LNIKGVTVAALELLQHGKKFNKGAPGFPWREP
jgi:hypothetical protein